MIVWRPSNNSWYARKRTGQVVVSAHSWGNAGDIPLVGDLDWDGTDDMVIWRPTDNKWYGWSVQHGRIFTQGSEPAFGARGDIPLIGDVISSPLYRDAMFAWRQSTGIWYGLQPNGQNPWPGGGSRQWGLTHDVPFLADMNDDDADDVIVYRHWNSGWYSQDTNNPGGDPLVWNMVVAAPPNQNFTVWTPGESYSVDDYVEYNGETWKCVYNHTSLAHWYPGAPGVYFWQLVPTGMQWAPNVSYEEGEYAIYNGQYWECTMSHVSQVDWSPGAPGVYLWSASDEFF